ncbi:MAG TPA: acyl-CoA dehydrogenase family protein [Aeromicrobium sp.]|nr:acyl-CoA dehydrogenase family protein [Aeromicrobium sp.]
MKFELTSDQRDFAKTLDSLLSSANTPSVARAWAAGDHASGLELWRRLTDLGVPALLVPEEDDGVGASAVEHVIAMEALGRHAVPGPWIESAGYLATCADPSVRKAVAAGTVGTVERDGYALDADVAELLLGGQVGERVASVDPVRRLFRATSAPADPGISLKTATLAASAQLLGAGERMLADSVEYVQERTQFGRPIGSYQAIKHALADVRIALDFVRPLVYAAALDEISVSAAKVAAGDAAYLASRTALQVHGAIGYTREHDLSLWLLRVRGLMSSWGTARMHRVLLIDELTEA